MGTVSKTLHRCGALVALLTVLAACEQTQLHRVELVIPKIEASVRRANGMTYNYQALAGFACVNREDVDEAAERNKPFLYLRAFSAQSLAIRDVTIEASVVVDAIRIGGYPHCRVSQIAAFCNDTAEGCGVIERERRCFDLDPLTFSVSSWQDALDTMDERFASYLEDGLAGRLVASEAVDEEVLIRVVGTTQTCAELEASGSLAFDPTQLLGCAYSCPLVPSAARGEIMLDLDTLSAATCESSVRACASPNFKLAVEDAVEVDPETALPARRSPRSNSGPGSGSDSGSRSSGSGSGGSDSSGPGSGGRGFQRSL